MSFFTRKSSKNGQAQNGTNTIRSRPSLPELHSQGIPWPDSLVDVSSIHESPNGAPARGAAISYVKGPNIPFHKPFRTPSTSEGKTEGGPISSLYMSHPPSSFANGKPSGRLVGRASQRRARHPPTFNLMVAGGKNTGKTSLLRLLLETADISPTATLDQQAAVERFMKGRAKVTKTIQAACIEICESRFDRVLFSVIDTPGIDFVEGRELKLERQVSTIMKYLDAQFYDTMSEESKVVRENKGDQHIHLCIYMIDPSSIMSAGTRKAQSSFPSKTRSETTLSYPPPDLVPDSASINSEDEESDRLTMSPAEIRVIRRLSTRANVLPVIALADSLTDDKLAAVKEAVRRDLAAEGLDFGVFSPPKPDTDGKVAKKYPGNGLRFAPDETKGEEAANAGDGDEDEERPSRPVIKLRPTRHASARLSRSRSRRSLKDVAAEELPDNDRDSIANVRFSAHLVAKTDLDSLLPFALIAPEDVRQRRKMRPPRPASAISNISSPVATTESHADFSTIASPTSPTGTSIRNLAYLQGPPDDLKGVFTRKFRWGTIDVLDPQHCDFAALRTTVFSTHIKALKMHTKEVLYEKYRTEKLLARRATQHITDDQAKRLLEELGL